LGRDKGTQRVYRPQSGPRRPPKKERLKESHDGVQSERPTPKPTSMAKPARRDKKSRGTSYSSSPSKSTFGDFIPRGGGDPNKGSLGEKSKTKLIHQKMVIQHELWNLKRSPHLRRLTRAVAKVKEGRNPFFKFKNLFRTVKIRHPGDYHRYNTILEGGILLTKRSMGIRLTDQIRKVKKLSYREMEILISKLPFWATSYEYKQIAQLAFAIGNRCPRGTSEALSPPKAYNRLRAPVSRGAYTHVPTRQSWRDLK